MPAPALTMVTHETEPAAPIRLVDPGTGALLTVPESDWMAISKRVGFALLLQDIAGPVGQELPGFPDLLAASRRWKDSTFPALVAQSASLADYAGEAMRRFEAIQRLITGLSPTSPLPPDIATAARAALVALSTATNVLNRDIAASARAVQEFAIRNAVVDADIADYIARLGPEWQDIQASTAAVETAAGHVTGIWQAIADDLATIASGKVAITMALLLSLDIDVAVRGWSALRGEALAFGSMAEGQQLYLTGQWLGTVQQRLP